MKYVLAAVAGFLICISGHAQGEKKALLIGVGKYAPGSRWTPLSSANDITYLRQAILQHGFDPKNITTLVDSQATKEGILKALTKLATESKPGDIIFFHFSGHGQQIQENENLDEIDGYDEALIPYDVMSGIRSTSYKGEKHLRDDEINPLLNQLRRNVGKEGSVFVTIDACHSGTATRGLAVTRGTPIAFEQGGYKPVKNFGEKKDGFSDDSEKMGNMVFFSASGPEQANFETEDANRNGVGSLSYALSKALLELPDSSSYDLLFHKVRSEIQGNYSMQTPMIEGNGSQLVFQNKFKKYSNIISYDFQDRKDDSTIIIKQGSLQGISTGSRFTLTSTTTNEVEAFGEIISVSPFQSTGRIRKLAENKKSVRGGGHYLGWEFINYEKLATYQIKNNVPVGIYQRQISTLLSEQSYLAPDENGDFSIEINKKDDGSSLIELVERGDHVRWSTILNMPDSLSDGQKLKLLDQIKLAMQAKTLRQLPNGGDLVKKVKVELLSASASFDNTGAAKSYEMIMKARDKYSLKIKNDGGQRVYFTVVNILPDNSTSVLVPLDSEQPKEFHLEPGDSTIIPGFTIDENPIPGKEVLRVLFTPEPIDLRPVFNRDVELRGQPRGVSEVQKVENALNDLIQTRYSGMTTRSGREKDTTVSEVGILTVGFTINKQ